MTFLFILALFIFKKHIKIKDSEKLPLLGTVNTVPLMISFFNRPDTVFLITALCILILGISDDVFGLSPMSKLFGQIIIAILFYLLSGTMHFIYLFLLIGTLNAFNLTDGIDGLLSIVSIIPLIFFFYFFRDTTTLFFIMTCSVLFAFNFPPAKMFLGDTGAFFYGFLLFYLSFYHLKQPLLLIFLAPYPFIDTANTVVRRILRKSSIFKKDTEHLHHKLRRKFGAIVPLIIVGSVTILNNVIFFTFLKDILSGLSLKIYLILLIMLYIEGVVFLYAAKNK